jgi:hypothetical protein
MNLEPSYVLDTKDHDSGLQFAIDHSYTGSLWKCTKGNFRLSESFVMKLLPTDRGMTYLVRL